MPWSGRWSGSWAGGSLSAELFQIVSVTPRGSRTLRVTFSRAPLFQSPIGLRDASNVSLYALTKTSVPIGLLGVRAAADDPNSVELLLGTAFATSPLLVYELVVSPLSSAEGVPLSGPVVFDFGGMPADLQRADSTRVLADLANPQTSATRLNGALQVGANGDYALEEGTTLIKKLLRRELLTARGEFYHLADTDYGFGLNPKTLVRPNELVTLRTQLESRLARVPELADPRVTVSLEPTGELDVRVSATIVRTAQRVNVQFPVKSPAVGG